ncbi:hypothetical protein BHM03_00015752 [Ensete ventricosum]|uniref:Uncharacterized protein n=1 Tax=Ensete ventricosum TaxID=4639 RepID=A0A427AI70_ENSVE|nr:hypothetical protein B296_00005083 [Ensete ventricosum]RZR88224.1 hypothetical protein BHM03_00015752 [Ensete ventricosum]
MRTFFLISDSSADDDSKLSLSRLFFPEPSTMSTPWKLLPRCALFFSLFLRLCVADVGTAAYYGPPYTRECPRSWPQRVNLLYLTPPSAPPSHGLLWRRHEPVSCKQPLRGGGRGGMGQRRSLREGVRGPMSQLAHSEGLRQRQHSPGRGRRSGQHAELDAVHQRHDVGPVKSSVSEDCELDSFHHQHRVRAYRVVILESGPLVAFVESMDKKKVAVPLVCHGHSRPVVDLFYSPVTPDGFFLISASKGERFF